MRDTCLASLVEINSHATRHELFASLCVLPHFRSIQMHLRPVPLVGSCLAASDPHVGPHWERLLLSGYLSIAVEQNGPAALVLMQQTAVLEVGHKRNLTLQATRNHQDRNKVKEAGRLLPCPEKQLDVLNHREFSGPTTHVISKAAMTCVNDAIWRLTQAGM